MTENKVKTITFSETGGSDGVKEYVLHSDYELLKAKLDKATKALRFYATQSHTLPRFDKTNKSESIAEIALKEIGDK